MKRRNFIGDGPRGKNGHVDDPIVFQTGADPVADGLVASMNCARATL